MDEANQWVDKLYPNGNVDWKEEHYRLLSVVEQFLDSKNQSHACLSILCTAAACGKELQRRYG